MNKLRLSNFLRKIPNEIIHYLILIQAGIATA